MYGEAPSDKLLLHLSHAQTAVTRSDQPAFESPPDSKKQPVTQHNPPQTTV
ncbi:hypothetical protein J6590_092694 [Homalodisca vitripennis]|nr:hypothetical protein J6590_092694 [Homalodisca vitripennis]